MSSKIVIALLAGCIAMPVAVSRSHAADLAAQRSFQRLAPVAPAFTWTGFYAGVNAGYIGQSRESNANSVIVPGFGTVTGSREQQRNGFLGGVQAGYNYQFTPGSGFVVGVEADIQYAGTGGRSRINGQTVTIAGTPTFVGLSDGSSINYLGTLRGRVGYAFERLLVYGTAGLAVGGGGKRSACPANLPRIGTCSAKNDDNRVGVVIGAGAEYALTNQISLKVEALAVGFEDKREDLGRANGAAVTRAKKREGDSYGIVRAGLNYRF